jgi:hypothetical protein
VSAAGPEDFRGAASRACDRLIRQLTRHRERYLRAWIAATGLDPRECELVEEHVVEEGVVKVVLYARPRMRL